MDARGIHVAVSYAIIFIWEFIKGHLKKELNGSRIINDT